MRLENRVKELEDGMITLKAEWIQMEYDKNIFEQMIKDYMFHIVDRFSKQLSKVIDDNDRLIKKNEDLEKVIEMICQKDGIVILRK